MFKKYDLEAMDRYSSTTEILKFVGYSLESKGLRSLNQEWITINISRDYKILNSSSVIDDQVVQIEKVVEVPITDKIMEELPPDEENYYPRMTLYKLQPINRRIKKI